MKMSNLTRAWRHELLDDAEIRRLDKMPSIAGVLHRAAPLVVFGCLCVDNLRHQFCCSVIRSLLGNVSHSEDMEVLESTFENVDERVVSIRVRRAQEKARLEHEIPCVAD